MLDACIASTLAGGHADHVIVVDNGGRAIADSRCRRCPTVPQPGVRGRCQCRIHASVRTRRDRRRPAQRRHRGRTGLARTAARSVGKRSDARCRATQALDRRLGSGTNQQPRRRRRWRRCGPRHRLRRARRAAVRAQTATIDSFTGGAVLFRSTFLQATSGFDESYFLYYEDLDLARRGAALGWTYRCVPASVVWHRVSASTKQLGDRARYLQERNRLRFAFRFGDLGTIGRALWLSVRRVRWSPRGAHTRALLAGIGLAPRALLARLRAR